MVRQACDGGWAYEEFLRCILESELRSRQEQTSARRLQEAHFPDIKTMDQLDWKALQGVSRPKLLELAGCTYLSRAEDVILAGPIGTGKSHIAIGLGVEAARRRFRVSFARAAERVRMLLEARKKPQKKTESKAESNEEKPSWKSGRPRNGEDRVKEPTRLER